MNSVRDESTTPSKDLIKLKRLLGRQTTTNEAVPHLVE